nr:apolipoprotein L4-like [Misgurnus anguillicaudatus]
MLSADNHGWMKDKPLEKFSLNVNDSKKMLNHLNQLSKIRMDQHTRMTFIWKENALLFIALFSKHRSKMEQFLSDLEESAVQLDKMKMRGSIFNIAGSSVGIVGGVLSIVGISLAPATVGVSLALTFAGLGLGVASSLVTGITESVNNYHCKNAQRLFQECIHNVEKIQSCLNNDVNHALFIDLFFISKDSISLAKGSKSETSPLIRSRVTLWKSELDAWQKIYDSLCIGIWRYRKSQKLLEQPFYPYKKSIIMRIWEMFIYIKNKICLKLKKIKMCIKSLYLKLLDQLDQIF